MLEPVDLDLDHCLATCEATCNNLRARPDCPEELAKCEDCCHKLRAAKSPGHHAFDWRSLIPILLSILQTLSAKTAS